MFHRVIGAACISLVLGLQSSTATAQTPYYKGKTVVIVAGTKAGDVYDLYARLFAEYLPKYIPGSPNIIVQNMAGRGLLDCRQFCLQRREPGRDDHRRNLPSFVFRSDHRPTGSQVRLEQVCLDRQPGHLESSSLHARGLAV